MALLTTAEVAELLNYTPDTVRRWRREGRGPAYIKDGEEIRYLPADIKAWISERRCDPNDTMATPTSKTPARNRYRSSK